MNNDEKTENLAAQRGVEVIPWTFDSSKIKGFYCDNMIALNKTVEISNEKACIPAEGLGHHEIFSGDIIDQSDTANRKQEACARLRAYDRLIGLYDIVKAYRQGCRSLYDMAERLDVTEDFLQDALQRYKSKYGTHTTFANYTIYFEPALCVYELPHEETAGYTAVGNDDTTA